MITMIEGKKKLNKQTFIDLRHGGYNLDHRGQIIEKTKNTNDKGNI